MSKNFSTRWMFYSVAFFGAVGVASINQTNQSSQGQETSYAFQGAQDDSLPVEHLDLVFAPNVPAPINRKHSSRVIVDLKASIEQQLVDGVNSYEFWTFCGEVPGPFIRLRVDDVMEVHLKNEDPSGMQHNVDFHCISGPGGGSALLTTDSGKSKSASFKMLYPGLYIYHCSVSPLHVHVANGMYGLILVEPKEGLPPVDKEFYVLQSEIYAENDPESPNSRNLVLSLEDLLNEKPQYVVFNGKANRHVDNPLQAMTDDRIRIFFGNAGPNLSSSLHVIGTVLDKVYRDGDMIDPPANGIHVTQVPAGGTSCIEFTALVPGTYSIIDHALSRLEKGCVAFLNVTGESRSDLYYSVESPTLCKGCKIHP